MTGAVRSATRADAHAIAAVEGAAAHRPWEEADVAHHLQDPVRCTIVAEWEGRIVGHALASIAADEGELLSVAVHPSARRRGLGSALLAALVDRWAARGVRTGWLEVREDNEAAVALYRRHGWEDAGRRKSYYHDGVDALVMRREVC